MSVLENIMNGDYDHQLDALTRAIRYRQKALRELEAAAIAIGDTIRTRDLKPKYLSDQEATVVDKEPNKLVVRFHDPLLRRRAERYLAPDGTARVPVTCAKLIGVPE